MTNPSAGIVARFKHNFFYFITTACICTFLACKSDYKKTEEYTEIQPQATFAGGASCVSCHEKEYELWKGSHHDQAMKIADSTSVLADFNNTSFTHKNIKSSFFKKDGDFYVNTEGPDGVYTDYKIEYTFGVYPLQQYIVAFPNGLYQCLITAWDSKDNKWFHLQPDLDLHHEEWMHWTGGSMNWNTMCADCHSTNLHKNFESESYSYDTTFSEINVSCEGCHGPGSAHNAYYEQEDPTGTPPKLYMGTGMAPKELVQKCARCHSRRSQFTDHFNYEGHFLDHYEPRLLIDPIYFVDGQIRDEDYVYASFVQSKMYSLGISCRDCHDMHSMKLKKTGNDLCLSCHLPKYATREHHFHEENTEGGECINCHMTGRYYMGNDFRNDHSFRIPRPDQTVKYGTPNACNSCHDDKSAQWAADDVIKNYGKARPDHFSNHLLEGFHNDKKGYETLMADFKYPEIARATAINQYLNHNVSLEDIQNLVPYLRDSSAMVRTETIRAIEKTGLTQFSSNIQPLLEDPIRLVRISAARYFNMIGADMNQNTAFKTANSEFLLSMEFNLDFASGHHQKALYYQAKNNTDGAIASYEKAIQLDNYYNMSRMNLALLYYQVGRTEESEALYLKVIEQEPDFGLSYYMLGLLYNEIGNNDKALEYLELATEKVPANVNAFYNYALKLQESGDDTKAMKIISKGLKTYPNNDKLLYIKVIGLVKQNKLQEAYALTSTLISIQPNNPTYLQLMQNIQSRLQAQ